MITIAIYASELEAMCMHHVKILYIYIYIYMYICIIYLVCNILSMIGWKKEMLERKRSEKAK